MYVYIYIYICMYVCSSQGVETRGQGASRLRVASSELASSKRCLLACETPEIPDGVA